MARRAIGYLRVNTTEQALSGLSLDAQRSAIEAECACQGWDLVDIVADEGVSGSKAPAKRTGLSDALTRISNDEADLLVALRLDRLGRDAVDVLNLTKSTEVALVDFPGGNGRSQTPRRALWPGPRHARRRARPNPRSSRPRTVAQCDSPRPQRSRRTDRPRRRE